MADKKTSQRDITAGGDVVAGDKIDARTTINSASSASEYLASLYAKCLEEMDQNPEQVELSEEFNYYNSKIEDDLLGLEEKLRIGGRTDLLKRAKESKEQYHKKLMKTSQFSKAGQVINIHLLEEVRRHFEFEVFPLIREKADHLRIDAAISERIISTLESELGVNPLHFTASHILGMLFFLTGNCHVRWAE